MTPLAGIDHHTHDGAPPWERPDPTPEDARRLAGGIVDQAIEDLAGWSREHRDDVEDWLDSLDDEPGSVEWCALVRCVAVDVLIAEVRERAHGLRLRRYAHRRDIEAAHNPRQTGLGL